MADILFCSALRILKIQDCGQMQEMVVELHFSLEIVEIYNCSKIGRFALGGEKLWLTARTPRCLFHHFSLPSSESSENNDRAHHLNFLCVETGPSHSVRSFTFALRIPRIINRTCFPKLLRRCVRCSSVKSHDG